MLRHIRYKKVLSAVLAGVMLMSLASCSSDKKTGYKLPEGASSEYDVYVKAVDYINGDADAIESVFDPVLTVVFYEKLENPEEDENYTLGLDIRESCELVSRMAGKISEMGLDEDYEYDDIDYEALIAELPEDRQDLAREDLDDFEDFVELIVYFVVLGETETIGRYEYFDAAIETVDEDDYSSTAIDDDIDSADFLQCFRDTRVADIGRVELESYYTYIECYIMEIDGAYYLIDFSFIYGSLGG